MPRGSGIPGNGGLTHAAKVFWERFDAGDSVMNPADISKEDWPLQDAIIKAYLEHTFPCRNNEPGKTYLTTPYAQVAPSPDDVAMRKAINEATFLMPALVVERKVLGFAGRILGAAESIGSKISQKQYRHILGRKEWVTRGRPGYFKTIEDAQTVLNAYHSGTAKIVGVTKQGHVVVDVEGVIGFNNNAGAGFIDQATSRFMIKGTSSPSVVPVSPSMTP